MTASPITLAASPVAQLDAGAPASPPVGATGSQPDQPAVDDSLHLTGRRPLKQLVRFVKNHAVHPLSEAAIVDAWHSARERIRKLEKEEAGLADDPPIGKLGPEDQPLLVEFLKDPLVRYGFNTVPTEVAMVELDRLVVYQKHVDVSYARRLQERLGSAPSAEAIFRTCLPYDHPQPPVKWSRVGGEKYVFVSASNDLRYLGPMPIEPAQIKDYPPPGDLVGVVGVAIGYGSNFLNAIYAEKRLILNNGTHRAYALRRMGITHVPCIVQHVSSREELELVGSSHVRHHPDEYLKHPRPSMLRDYFDPHLHLVMRVHRRLRQVTVRFEVEEEFVPAL